MAGEGDRRPLVWDADMLRLWEDGNWVNIDSEESCCFLSPTKGAERPTFAAVSRREHTDLV